MSVGPQEKTKLIVVPSYLVERLRAIALRQGVSLSTLAAEVLEQASRAEELGATLKGAVDLQRLVDIQRGAGAVNVSRSTLEHLISRFYEDDGEELRRVWQEAGRWYGEYLHTKLGDGEALSFLEKGLLISWNLDEVEMRDDGGEVRIRCASFMMSMEMTELLLSYVSGVMGALDYEETERDYLSGMATLGYRRALRRRS